MNEQEHLESQVVETIADLDGAVEQVTSQFDDTETYPHIYDVGEEVIYDEERYIISQIDQGRSSPYKLISSTNKGSRIVWAREKDLERMERYITAVHDSGQAGSY